MWLWPVIALSLLLPQEEQTVAKKEQDSRCQFAHNEETPSIFTESHCMDSVTLPGSKPPVMSTFAGEYCPDCPAVAGRIPLNPESFGKPFLGTSGAPPVFQGYTGIPTKIKVAFNGRPGGWNNMIGRGKQWAQTMAAQNANPNMMILMSLSYIPQDEGGMGAGLGKCAAGQFNNYYKEFALNMKALGVTSAIFRPGWEFTLKWPWGTSNDLTKAQMYRGCFRNFVATVQANYPENKFIYEWNVHQDGTRASMEAAWPGAEFVDVVGVDIYDAYFTNNVACRTDGNCRWTNRTQPVLDKIKSFADSVGGKPIAISELGIWTNTGSDTRGAGDNPIFIKNICDWVKDDANRVLYYAYFDEDADGDHRLGTAAHSQSLAAFRANCVGNPGNPHEELSP